MRIVVNPQKLTAQISGQLRNFFAYQSESGKRVWDADIIYCDANNNEFIFTQKVVQRKCKTGGGVRYEFISDITLGNGSFGSVLEIAGTLKLDPNPNNFFYKSAGYNSKKRVVKIQTHDDPTVDIAKEYNLSKKGGHLGIKEPVILPTSPFNTSYLVMKKAKGVCLDSIIRKEINNVFLSFEQRLELSKALLHALKTQVTDQGIIHRDITPENIRVDLTQPMSVTIIDFGLSIESDKQDNMNVGSYDYAPPEFYKKLPQTEQSDIFSMARVLALIWHVDYDSYRLSNM